jgi:hypothetical protein
LEKHLLQALDRVVIGINNLSVRGRRTRVAPHEVLLLLPSCLQAAGCKQNVVGDLDECRRCGRCKIGPLLDMAERYGVRVAIAKGGRVAVALARQDDVKAIVAVACEKELRSGIWACAPKATIAIANQRPNGPCNETNVNLDEVERAIRWLTRPGRPETSEKLVDKEAEQ